MVALIAALALQTSWVGELEDKGWTRRGLSSNQETMLFTRAGPRPNMIWSRQEFQSADRVQALSTVSLVEVDCLGRRSRTVQSTDFGGRNPTGQSMSFEAVEWRYPMPGSLGEAVLVYGCGEE